MSAPDPRLSAASRLRADAAWLGDLLAADALPPGEARAEAWRMLCDHLSRAADLDAAACAEARADAAARSRDLYGLLRLDRLFPGPNPHHPSGVPGP